MLGSVLNALSSSPNLSRASLHPFVLVLTLSLSLNSIFPSLTPSLPFPNTLRNMKEKSYPLSVFVSLSQTCHTFLVSSCKISFPFPDHPRSPPLLPFQYEFIFPGEKNQKSVRANSLLVPPSLCLSSILFCVTSPELQFRFMLRLCHRYKKTQTITHYVILFQT